MAKSKPTVYIETSIVSYLTARQSADVRVRANQGITTEWWETRRPKFDLFVSEFVIAVATVNGMDYLLTWNCTHIANAAMRAAIERVCRKHRYEPPIICTPLELMEG
jgi:hypothetical protein